MKLKKVDPKTILIPDVRVTARFDEDKLAMFKESIRTTGQVAPIICVETPEGIVLVDGLHRLQEAIANKSKTIDVALTEGDMVDVLTKNIFVDHLRGKTPVSEIRKVVEALYQEYHVGIEDIVKRTGLSQSYVEKLLVISDLTPMVLEALDDERIGVGHAAVLTKIKSPTQQEVVFGQLMTYHWTVKALEDYVKMVQETPPPVVTTQQTTEPQEPVTIACQFCHEQHEARDMASVLVCKNCTAIMFEAIAVARSATAGNTQEHKDAKHDEGGDNKTQQQNL